jgi:hypothetical protein
MYGASAEQMGVCQDLNDYYALGDQHVSLQTHHILLPGVSDMGNSINGFHGLAQCGFGTHSEKCGEKVVYAHADAPGGCEQTCHDPVMEKYIDSDWNKNNKFDYSTFCSDGGEGSRRVLFKMPSQRDPRSGIQDKHRQEYSTNQYRYYDFACPYGTQVNRAAGPPTTHSHKRLLIPRRVAVAVPSVRPSPKSFCTRQARRERRPKRPTVQKLRERARL